MKRHKRYCVASCIRPLAKTPGKSKKLGRTDYNTEDMKEANGWHLADLNTIAASYATSTLKDEKLFSKLAAATAEISPEKLMLGCGAVWKLVHRWTAGKTAGALQPFPTSHMLLGR